MNHYSAPEDLLNAAQLGKRLKPRERMSVVMWLEKTGDIENYPDKVLANHFQCRPAAIKRYRDLARKEFAKAISTDEAMNYMADFVRGTDLLIREARSGMKSSPQGSGAHQGYIRLLKELESEKVDKLQSIGVIPKELGRLTTITEEWTAEVSEKGVASVRNTSETGPDGSV